MLENMQKKFESFERKRSVSRLFLLNNNRVTIRNDEQYKQIISWIL